MLTQIDLICSDGAAALVLVSGQKALELGLQVIAKIRGYADAAQVCIYLCIYICDYSFLKFISSHFLPLLISIVMVKLKMLMP